MKAEFYLVLCVLVVYACCVLRKDRERGIMSRDSRQFGADAHGRHVRLLFSFKYRNLCYMLQQDNHNRSAAAVATCPSMPRVEHRRAAVVPLSPGSKSHTTVVPGYRVASISRIRKLPPHIQMPQECVFPLISWSPWPRGAYP